MFKRVLTYIAVAVCLFFVINQYKFSAPLVFENWQTVELVWAAKKGDIQKMDQLIEEGADVNSVGKFSFTPLTWVLTMVEPSPKAKSGFKHLLINGANSSDLIPMSSNTALHFTSRFNDSHYLEIIIKHAHDLKINDNRFGKTPLVQSIYSSQFKNFQLLLDNGAEFEKQNDSEKSVLNTAKGTSSWQYALELLKRGANYTEGQGIKTPNNPEGLSSIVYTLENVRYWPSAAINTYGIDYREKVIEFLRNEGVEVYPWYPKDDPHYNPNPKAVLCKT